VTGPTAAGAGVSVNLAAVTRRYGDRAAVDGVSLDIPAGRFVVLLGPSGSGKTTLLRLISGTERLTDGRIEIGRRPVAAPGLHLPPDRRNLGMVFQDYALWPHLTAEANVAFALRRRGIRGKAARRRAGQLLDRVGLGRFRSRHPGDLSGGEQQRVAIARALVADPPLLLFDEPLSNLDADLREQLRVEIATLTRDSGATAVYITHDQSEAFALADAIGVLRDGRLVQYADAVQLYHRPATPFVARFTGLSAELPGVVAAGAVANSVGDGECVVATHGARLRARPMGACVPDASVRVLIRPAAVSLHPAGSLDATVTDTAYRGRGYDHAVRTAAGATFTGVFAARAVPRGTAVRLRLDPEGCLAYPAGGDGDERDGVAPEAASALERSGR